MNITKSILLLAVLLIARVDAQPVTIPGSQFPIVTHPSNYFRFLGVDTNGQRSVFSLTRSNFTTPYDGLLNSISNDINVSGLVSNGFNTSITNTAQPFVNVINVKASPYNAVGNGVHDDWVAIQSALTAASLASGPVSVYIPAGSYRLTNTLALTTQTNSTIVATGEAGLSRIFGDGALSSVLNFTNRQGNGIEFRLGASDPRRLSHFKIHDLGIVGPSSGTDTNTFGSGIFLGFDATVPYPSDTSGWHDTLENLVVKGFKEGICITNTVFTVIRNCNLTHNVLNSAGFAHVDTIRLENNLYGTPIDTNDPTAGIVFRRDFSGIAGAGALIVGGECGDVTTCFYIDSEPTRIEGGHCERNGALMTCSNSGLYSISGFYGFGFTNIPFVFHNISAGNFWADSCTIVLGNSNLMFSVYKEGFGLVPIHHALNVAPTNTVVDGVMANFPPVFFQTPRWSQNYQLANITQNGGVALTPTSTSPSPFFSADGLSITNATCSMWLRMPSGLGNNYNDNNFEDVRFTVMIQGGIGNTNGSISLNTFAYRNDPVLGQVSDTSPSFTISGITNGMCKVFSWTNSWTTATSDGSQRYLRANFQSIPQSYLIGLSAETIDY